MRVAPLPEKLPLLIYLIRGEKVPNCDAELASQILLLAGEGSPRHSLRITEQGIARLSSVLRSPRAVEVNIAIMRTFVQLRRLMDSNRRLARKIEAMEKKYDEQFGVVFDAIKRLIAEDDARKSQPRRGIGFVS